MDPIRIKFEEADLEEFAMDGGLCVAVPMEISVFSEGETEITVFSRFEGEASAFVEKFSADLFCDAAFDHIASLLNPQMEEAGYESGGKQCGHILCFSADSGAKIKRGNNLPDGISIVKIENTAEFSDYVIPENLDAQVDDDDPCDVYYVAVDGDKIVSFAGVNDLTEEGLFEINVETDENYRGRGLGAAVASELINHLLSLGERVLYCCTSDNTASVKLAKRIGLELKKESLSLVYYASEV